TPERTKQVRFSTVLDINTSDWDHSPLTNDSTTRVSLNTSEWEKDVSPNYPVDLTQPSTSTATSSFLLRLSSFY
ncbi:unnamed protein product, partial [Didymodactylos carnosus]